MAQYVSQANEARRVIDFVDIDSDKWIQYAQSKHCRCRGSIGGKENNYCAMSAKLLRNLMLLCLFPKTRQHYSSNLHQKAQEK